MRGSVRQDRGIGVGTASWPVPSLVDHVLATYVEWRETTDAVVDAYARWCVRPAGEEAARFAAYLAALDQEQAAAGVYAESIIEVERRLWNSDSDRGSQPRPPFG